MQNFYPRSVRDHSIELLALIFKKGSALLDHVSVVGHQVLPLM